MLDLQGRKLVQLVAAAIFVTLVVQGFAINTSLREKTSAQLSVVDGLDRWRQQYMAVAESRGRWEKQYRRIDSVHGVDGLIELINLGAYGLQADPDRVLVTQASEIMAGTEGAGTPLGLIRTCLASSAGERDVFEVSAPSYQALMAGIDKLARRPDISIGNISVKGDKKEPIGRLGEFCVLLRND